MRKIAFIFIVFLIWSCGSAETDNLSGDADSSDVENVAPNGQIDENAWESFWTDFQAAVANSDIDKIKSMAIWNETFNEKDFDEMSDFYFSEAMKKLIASTSAGAVEKTEAVDSYAQEGRQVVLSESGYDEEEGIEYESALFLYFGKIEEKYGLVMFMAAG